MKNKFERYERILGIAFALLVWQIAAMVINEEIILSSPVKSAIRLLTLCKEPDFWHSAMFSLKRIFIGFSIGLVSGIILSVCSARFRLISILLKPFVSATKTIPVASFVVISLIWFTSRSLSIFISFLMVFPIIYTNLLDAIRGADTKLLEMAAIFTVPAAKKILYIYIPQIFNGLISACSVALGLAWKAGIAAEVIAIPSGSIGERLYEAKLYLDTADLFAWTITIICLSVLFEKLFTGALKLLYKLLRRI